MAFPTGRKGAVAYDPFKLAGPNVGPPPMTSLPPQMWRSPKAVPATTPQTAPATQIHFATPAAPDSTQAQAHAQYEDQMMVLQQTLNTLSAHLESEKDENKKLKEENKKLHSELVPFQNRTQDMHRQFEMLKEEQRAKLYQNIANQKEEFEREKQRLNEHYRNTAMELQNREAVLQEREAELQRVIDQRDEEIEALKKEKDALKEWLDKGVEECKKVVEEVGELKKELQATEQRVLDAKADKEAAVQELKADREKLEQTIDVLVNEIKVVNEKQNTTTTDSADKDRLLAQHLVAIQGLESELAKVKADLAAKNDLLKVKYEALLQATRLSSEIRDVALQYSDMKFELELGRSALPEPKEPQHAEGEDTPPAPLPATNDHMLIVELTGSRDLLCDINEGLRNGILKLKGDHPVPVSGDATGLTKTQQGLVTQAATMTYKDRCPDLYPGTPNASAITDMSTTKDILLNLGKEWGAKEGDVLDELLGHLVPVEGVDAFAVIAEAARAVRGSTPPFPGLNLMELVLLRLFTMTAPDVDLLMLHGAVPQYSNYGAWQKYNENARNPCISNAVASAMTALVAGGADEKSLSSVRPWLKVIGLLTALSHKPHTNGSAGRVVFHGPECFSEGVTMAPLQCSLKQSTAPSGIVSDVRYGVALQPISAYPNDNSFLLPPGAVLKLDGSTSDGTFYSFEHMLASNTLSEWMNRCKEDAERASARLEQALAQRGIHEVLDITRDRMDATETRHTSELAIMLEKQDEMQRELDALAQAAVESQGLVKEAYNERDDALGRYADEQRKRMLKEIEKEEGDLQQTQRPAEQQTTGAACEDCVQRRAEVSCALCRARLCTVCSERIHSGGIMKSHPVRVLEHKRKRAAIDTARMDPNTAADVRKLEARYEKMKEKLKAMKVDWAKLGDTRRLLQQIEHEKHMLKDYIKKLEVENDGLRRMSRSGHGSVMIPRP